MFTSSHLPSAICLQNWFQNFCCIFYALLLCSRCNINLSPPIKANTAKISTQEFLTNRLRNNMKLLILLCITAYYLNILFFMSSNKWYQDFTFASFFKSLLCCLKGSSNKKKILSPNHLNLIFLIGVWYSSFWSDGLKTT